MNIASVSSLVSHRTSRPVFFYPSEASKSSFKGVTSATSVTDLSQTNKRHEGCESFSNESNFSIFHGFGSKLVGSSCPTKSVSIDRPLKAEGVHALKQKTYSTDGCRSFVQQFTHSERISGTRKCPLGDNSTSGLKLCREDEQPKLTVSENCTSSLVPSVSGVELVKLLAHPDQVVIVDCRNFMVFNANHIEGAVNVNLANKITKKRFIDGHLSIADLVSGAEAKSEYRYKEQNSLIVIYDDNTVDLSLLPAGHPLKLLASRLRSEGRDARYLEGGIQSFQTSFCEHCAHPDAQPTPPLLYSPTSQDVDAAVDNATASQILPFLIVGNERDASNDETLKELGITHILNVTTHIPFYFEDRLNCKRLQASDSGCQNLKQYFEEAINFIESARVSNGRVLVHCQAGVSRSPTIVMAYIIARFEKSMQETFTFMHNRRSIISPNLNFMGQLLEFSQRTDLSSLFTNPLSCTYPELTVS